MFYEFIKRIGQVIKCEACRAFYIFFATSLINSIIQKHEIWFIFTYDIKITLKSHLELRKNVMILICTLRCYGIHNVSLKSVNH